MEELTIKEKAKAYDEALIRGSRLWECGEITKENYEYMFSELRESEDERIRKALIELIQGIYMGCCTEEAGKERDMFLAWLEKQGESKPIGKLQLSEELYEHIRNTCACIDDALSSETLADINDYLSMAEHSAKSAFDMIEKQGEQKPVEPQQDMLSQEKYAKAVDECIYGEQKPNPCDGCVNCKGCINCENGELREVEQKPADKVEPKLKVEKDKWYVCTSQYCNCIEGRNYKATSDGRIIDDYGTEYDMHSDAYKWFRPWIIQDAKDGDVLADGNLPFIFKKIDTNKYSYAYCGISIDDGFKIESDVESVAWTWMQDIKPATKEQRDLLFKKMHEAGYEWDAEKKELKKSEEEPKNFKKQLTSEMADLVTDYIKQKPAESINEAYPETLDKAIDLYYYSYGNGNGYFEHLSFEKFKDIVKTFVSDYSKQNPAWSEEDEKIRSSIIDFIRYELNHHAYIGTAGVNSARQIEWLESLKDRVIPQNKWKPSDEQITWLYRAADDASKDSRMKQILNELLYDLKKLRE